MRILGLDYGTVRTGVAICDSLGITAQGIESIKYDGNKKNLLNRLKKIINLYGVEKIVIGYPINMNATKGIKACLTDEFIRDLEEAFHLEVIKVDERLTTVSAQKTMTYLGVKKEKKKDIVDTISAVYILQMYLDRCKISK